MAKVMLVEDDNNLREIYEARLLAEGYEIVSAQDGEEALALAVKEKPDLIIADIMMPKISGFDMLDILRSTPETKNTKVIMMTALSQAEDKARATKLGADRYLVKSQVTLEDVARVAKEVLAQVGPAAAPGPSSGDTPAATTPPVQSSSTPTGTTSATPPANTSDPATTTNIEVDVRNAPAPAPSPAASDGSNGGTTTVAPQTDSLDRAVASLSKQQGSPQTPESKTAVHTKVINPINDVTKSDNDFQTLLAKEEAKEAALRGQGSVGQSIVGGGSGPTQTVDPNSVAL